MVFHLTESSRRAGQIVRHTTEHPGSATFGMARFNSPVFQIIFIVCLSLLPSRNSCAVIQLLLHKVRKPKLSPLSTIGSTQHLPTTATTPPFTSDDQISNLSPLEAGLTSSDHKPRDLNTLDNKERNGWLKVPLMPSDGSSDKPDGSGGESAQDSDEEMGQALPAEQHLNPPKQFPLKNSGETLLLLRLPRHNIKESWCRMHPFEQEIRHHGCNSTVINNHMCYGQCNSFYIPGNFVSCSRCAPSTWKIITVELKCPGRSPNVVVKNVKITESCDCRPCDA